MAIPAKNEIAQTVESGLIIAGYLYEVTPYQHPIAYKTVTFLNVTAPPAWDTLTYEVYSKGQKQIFVKAVTMAGNIRVFGILKGQEVPILASTPILLGEVKSINISEVYDKVRVEVQGAMLGGTFVFDAEIQDKS